MTLFIAGQSGQSICLTLLYFYLSKLSTLVIRLPIGKLNSTNSLQPF